MRKILLSIALTLSLASTARVRYMATTGNNGNAGTLGAPWLTLEYCNSQLIAGDTLYIRGGSYSSSKATSIVNRFQLNNLVGTVTDSIKIMNFPGESVVFDLSTPVVLGTAGDGPVGLKVIDCAYLRIKGIRVSHLSQNPANINTPAGMVLYNVDNSLIELVEVDHIEGYGFYLQGGSDNNLIKNTDVHHVGDVYSGWTGANGFNLTGGDPSTNNVWDGCRAWWCSDDGFDFFGTATIATMRNCWSFWNGYQPGTFTTAGDGMGFKLGPMNADFSGSSTIYRRLYNCLAFENRLNGFDQNSNNITASLFEMYNNTSASNGSNGFFFGANTSINQRFRNNVNFNNNLWGSEITTGPNVSNNTWNGAVTLTSADFVSVSSAGMDGPRQADGSLPVLNYLHLAPGSDLINAGVNVGLPFNGAAPDMGAFETGGNYNPTAAAGSPQTITLPTSGVTLSGSGSDLDGTIAGYSWTMVLNADPAAPVITTPTSATTTITGLTVAGTYIFRLTVTDNLGATGYSDVTITVLPAGTGGGAGNTYQRNRTNIRIWRD